MFKGFADANATTGALTITYSADPTTISWIWLDLDFTSPNVTVAGSEKRSAANDSATANTLKENIGLNAFAHSKNRPYVFANGNVVAATFRPELDADTNGDADWVSIVNTSSGSAPVQILGAGWRDSQSDLTPGWMSSSSIGIFISAVEVDYRLEIAATVAVALGALDVQVAATPETPPPASGSRRETRPNIGIRIGI
jgi:hypothetical protein